jgi:hypothetical protein
MQNGAAGEKVEAALGNYKKTPLFSLRERLALELAERMTYTGNGSRISFSIVSRNILPTRS